MSNTDKQILIVEDNPSSMNLVCKILGEIKELEIFKAKSSEKAYKYAMEYDIDLFIVDLVLDTKQLGDVSGIKFIERIRTIEKYKFTPVIVTTSLEDPRLHSYANLHCYRYFEKPYDKEEFQESVIEALKYTAVKEKRKFIYYKKEGILYSVKIKDIVYIVNNSKNITIYCIDNNILTAPYKSCKDMLYELNSPEFLQCSKNTIVNKEYIMNVDPANRYIMLANNYGTIEIGTRMKKIFLKGLSE